jgi:anti-sigma factor RsiW
MEDQQLDALLARTPELPADEHHVDDAVLHAYVRRTLAEDRRPPIERHLAGCPECRLLAEGLALAPNISLLAFGKGAVGKRSWPKKLAAGAAVLAAAVLLFALIPPRGAEPVPAFTMEGPFGGVQSVRSEKLDSRQFDENSRLKVIFRPASPAPELALDVYVSTATGSIESTAGELERGDDGLLLYRAPARVLFGDTRGPYTLSFVLRRGSAVVQKFDVEVEYR